jgi:hypothetical protein
VELTDRQHSEEGHDRGQGRSPHVHAPQEGRGHQQGGEDTNEHEPLPV